MKTSSKLFLSVVFALCLGTHAFAADTGLTGTWKWTVQARQGGASFDQSLKLEEKDGKVSGTMVGRQGGQFSVPDTPITEVTWKNGVLKFSLTREFNGRSYTTKYEGQVQGDTITGVYERPGLNGGDPVKAEWVAHRQK